MLHQPFYCAACQSGTEWAQRPGFPAHLTYEWRAGRRPVERKEGPLGDAQASEPLNEAQKIRRLQIMISMVMSVISQDVNLTVEEASELVAGTKRAALAMFPDKELAYDILYKPRLQRLMRERFHLQ